MMSTALLTAATLCATACAQNTYHCNALDYAQPGFVSDRRLYPPDKHDHRVWDGMHKVAFQKSDCTWLAANFKDTGSPFVAILFAGFTQHKEDWPQPEIALYLANSHGLSSLAVDPAGRGESCGYEYGPGYESLISDMEAAAQFINSLPGRYAGALFGLSSGGTASLFYAAQIADIPVIVACEPDDMAILPGFIDQVSGGDVAKRLAKMPELEITVPNRHDRLILTAEGHQVVCYKASIQLQQVAEKRPCVVLQSMRNQQNVNLTAMVQQIPPHVHIYWYTAENGAWEKGTEWGGAGVALKGMKCRPKTGTLRVSFTLGTPQPVLHEETLHKPNSSLTSEMKDLSFAHIPHFQHRHFLEANHDFRLHHPALFLKSLAADMGVEAAAPAVAMQYQAGHRHSLDLEKCWVHLLTSQQTKLHRALTPSLGPRRKAMPKHMFINEEFRSSGDQGLVNPAAVQLADQSWYVFMMQYKGCFGSDCPLQMQRAYNKPLLACMGKSSLPDPQNITQPSILSYNQASWAATVEMVGAHPLGGLRFTSFRPFVYQKSLHVSYAMEIFDKSLPYADDTPMDAYKMRFQGTGFSRVDMQAMELVSVAAFDMPLIPRQEFPCCDKNWGMLEIAGELYIFYTVLPCLTVFKLDSTAERGTTLVYASCIVAGVQPWLASASGLELRDVRISGHPIVWSQYPQTLLVVVHHNWRRNGGSKHWGILMQFDPARRRFLLTAVSAQPVMTHEDFILHNEAVGVENVIAIGSYHLAGSHLRMLYGDGDKYSAYTDVEVASIPWVYLNQTSAEEWCGAVDTALGDTIDSITYTEYESMVW